MERARQRKLKIPTVIEGSKQNSKQRTVSKLATDSSSCSGGTTKEDLFMFEPARSSSRRVTGMPMKNLLAGEMPKEAEAKRRSPSVIARLMGLDGLPSPQSVHRQQKRLLENHQYRTRLQNSGPVHESRSSSSSSMDRKEFKDVYEDLEASHITNRRYSSKWTSESKLTKPEMAFMQQKFRDAKRLSTDETLHGSKEFSDTHEMLDSNKDLVLKFLRQPDSLFVKHLLDLRGDPTSSPGRQITVLRPSNTEKYEDNAKIGILQREISCKHCMNCHRKREDGLLCHSLGSSGAHNSLKSSKMRLERKDTDILPTRIVVLKPNPGKARSDIKCDSSFDSSHANLFNYRKHKDSSIIDIREIELCKKKDSYDDIVFSRPKFREVREIAKEITRQMRERFPNGPINLRHSGIRGYTVDTSSYNVSGSDSASESEVMTSSFRNSLHWNNINKSSSFGSTESIGREAKKRLSDRWKMIHRYQDLGAVGRGSTLGEMLAIPDRETKLENLDAMMGQGGASGRFVNCSRTVEWDSPLGISSGDGWKDGCIRSLSRSRSLPPKLSSGSHKKSSRQEAFVDDRYLMRKEAMNHGRSKVEKGNHSHKEDFSSKNLRSSSKQSLPSCDTCTDGTDSLPETNFIQIQMGTKDLFGLQPTVSQKPAKNYSCTSSFVADAEHESVTLSSRSSDELLPKLSTRMLGSGDSSACGQEDSNLQEPSCGPSEGNAVPLQCPGPEREPESSQSSKEADHRSPLSVLEVPFTEDASSGSECFERVSADLQELRMQLQLLKMESKAYTEVPMLNASDEEVRQGFITIFEENEIFRSQSWESSYVVDVLIHSAFHHTAPDVFIATWHSPECPLGLWIFDNLETYYETTGMKFERRLLFDRINAAFLEMFQWFVEPCPWVKSLTKSVGMNWQKHGVKDDMHKLLANQEKIANEDVSEKLLDREMHWFDIGDDIDVIGKELESLLIDDLITEVVCI